MRARLLRGICCLIGVAAFSFAHGASAGDWTRFRGPNGSGISTDTQPLPTTWSDSENLSWKVALPGPGSSSPIIVGDRVLVTCWTGYGTDRGNPGEQENLRRELICLDAATGAKLWSKEVEAALPEDDYRGMFAEHGYASHTPVSDGKHVYVFFGKTGVLAFDLQGNQLWHTKVGDGTDPRNWGSASSPILYNNLVIVPAAAESQALVALDKVTGKEVWRKEAKGFTGTWGTPVLVKVDENRTDLVLGVPYEIWGFDPETGKLRWYCEVNDADSFCSSVIAQDGVVYAIEGRGGGSVAVKAGGSGDVTKTHVLWSGRDRNRIGTPVMADGLIYFMSGGVANCIKADNGERVYQARLSSSSSASAADSGGGRDALSGGGGRRGMGGRGGRGGQDYSSPVSADGKLYFVSRAGDAFVIKLGDKFEQLAVNRLTEETEDFSATPAVSDGKLFIRSSKHLYCVAQK